MKNISPLKVLIVLDIIITSEILYALLLFFNISNIWRISIILLYIILHIIFRKGIYSLYDKKISQYKKKDKENLCKDLLGTYKHIGRDKLTSPRSDPESNSEKDQKI